MKYIFAVSFWFFYWGVCILCTGGDRKNLLSLRSYPEGVQRLVRQRKELLPYLPKEKALPAIVLSDLLLFTAAFSALGLLLKGPLGLTGYLAAFRYFLLLGEGLGLFDLVVIDLLWWRNTKRIRFSFLPEKAPYQDPQKHIGSFLRGIVLFAAIAALAAGIVAAL